jgi:hypothetical protein
MKADDIIREASYLRLQKSGVSTFFQEIVDYVLPDRSNVTRFEQPGTRRGVNRYDSTAVEAAEILAGNLAATLTPQAAAWFSLGVANEQLNMRRAIRDWCEDCRDLMLSAMAKSNFYLAIDEVYLDLVGFATACPYTEMVNGRLHFMTWAVREYTFAMDATGRANTIYREFTMTPAQIIERFQNHPGKRELGPTVMKATTEFAQPEDKHKSVSIIQAIYPRTKYDPRQRGQANMPFASCYVNVDDRVVMAEGGYEEMPANVTRWRVTSDDDGWGRGPAFTAMPDIRSLNAAKRMMHRAAAKDIDPPLIIDDKGVIGSVRTVPNGITYLRANSRMEYLTSGARMDLAQFDIADIKAQIRSCFYADHLRLPPPQSQPMTATEIQIRWELMERLMGPTLGRLQTELLNPVLERVFGLMMRAGMLPPPPQELNDQEIDIEYIGPLARAQQMPDVIAIERAFQTAANIAAVTGDPAPFDLLDADEAVKRAAMLQGVPSEVLRDEDEVAQIRAQRAEQAQAMQDRQDVALTADVASKASKVPTQAAA